jgi:mevalonate kinase
MTSQQTRRLSSGKIKTKPHSRSSSSTTISVQIGTPSDSSPSTSPSIDMPLPKNGSSTVNAIHVELEATTLNGSRKSNRGATLNRKQSSPMMPAFMVSAPGKAIVFGEHAVVHGKVRSKVYCLGMTLILTGGHCCICLLTVVPPGHSTLKIEENHLTSVSRYQSLAHMESR